MNAQRFEGRLPEADGDYGGTCTLVLEDGRFVLEYVRRAPYGISDGDILRGTWTASGSAIVLESNEHVSYHEETVRQESTRRGHWRAELRATGDDAAEPLAAAACELVLDVQAARRLNLPRYVDLVRAAEA